MGEREGQSSKWKGVRVASLVLYTSVVSLVRRLHGWASALSQSLYYFSRVVFFQVYLIINDPTFHEVSLF